MAIKPNRKCIICGTRYAFCYNCRDNRDDVNHPWHNIYDSEECMNIANTWYAYRGNEVSKKDAKILIERYPNALQKIFCLDTVAANEIKEICDYGKTAEDPIQEEVTPVVEEVKEVVKNETVAENKPKRYKKK